MAVSAPPKCAHCGNATPCEWVSGKLLGGGISYAMKDGLVVLCSAKCDHAYLEALALKRAVPSNGPVAP